MKSPPPPAESIVFRPTERSSNSKSQVRPTADPAAEISANYSQFAGRWRGPPQAIGKFDHVLCAHDHHYFIDGCDGVSRLRFNPLGNQSLNAANSPKQFILIIHQILAFHSQ